MCLTACATATPGNSAADAQRAPRKVLAPLCPLPTPPAKIAGIERELVAAIAANASPDTLATEWERLDAAARICRGEK